MVVEELGHVVDLVIDNEVAVLGGVVFGHFSLGEGFLRGHRESEREKVKRRMYEQVKPTETEKKKKF